MPLIGWVQAAVIFGVVCALVKPLGTYMARVYEGRARVAQNVRESRGE